MMKVVIYLVILALYVIGASAGILAGLPARILAPFFVISLACMSMLYTF